MKQINLFEPNLSNLEKKFVLDSLNKNQISSYGYFNDLLEKEIKKVTGSKYNLTISSGSAGLYIALKSTGIKKDEIVITQSYTFSATTNAIMLNNSIPLLVDISYNDLNIDFENLKNFFDKETFTKQNSTYHKKTKKKISCLCLVFTLGLIPDLKKVEYFRKKYNLKIIFDAACALGSKYKKKDLAKFCDAAIYSLNGNKNFTSGAGGILSTEKKSIFNYARKFSNNGKLLNSYNYKMIGFNFRMSSLNAAVGLGQVKRFNKLIQKKKTIRNVYSKNLKPIELFNCKFKWGNYLPWINFIFLNKKTKLKVIDFLKKNKIFTNKFWLPMHMQPVKKNFILTDLRNTKKIYESILVLPSSTFLLKKDIVKITKLIKKIKHES
jgi:perosamine synthetase